MNSVGSTSMAPLASIKQEAYLIWANHQSTVGIGEIVFTVASCLGGRYALKPARTIKPGKLNIIIDEFTHPYFVKNLAEVKKADPTTKYIVVATEFITPVSIFGVELARTFNFFGGANDWARLVKDRLRQGANQLPSYMQSRYFGFMKALAVCDILVFVHPSIGGELADVAQQFPNLVSPPAVIYPELSEALGPKKDRLEHLRIGFNLTGTFTPYRRKVMTKLARRFRQAGWSQPIWNHVSFKDSKPIEFTDSAIDFHYDVESKEQFLFNINPPQQANWPFSSPMRILRAALLGHIPVVTTKLHDHDIEDIAVLWDGQTDSALEMTYLEMDRRQFVDNYLQSVEGYNAIAKGKNWPFLQSLEQLFK
jgi:hypothetical protein